MGLNHFQNGDQTVAYRSKSKGAERKGRKIHTISALNHFRSASGKFLPSPHILAAMVYIIMIAVTFFASSTSSLQTGVTRTVNVDASIKYQTMEGFGASEHDIYPPDSFFPVIFDDLGVSVLRFSMGAKPESNNDNNNPFIIDWDKVTPTFDYSGVHGVSPLLPPLLQEAQRRKIKLFGTIYSPPAWMKSGASLNGGSLSPGFENEFAEFVVIWIKGIEKYCGIHIDYISLQNEPNYSNSTWATCKYDASKMRDIVKLVGARFALESITSKIVAPEVSNLKTFNNDWADTLCRDSKGAGYTDRLATHTYNQDYWNPDASIKNLQTASGLANKYNMRLWMTEYSNDGGSNEGTWIEALRASEHVHNALIYGNVTAYLAFELYQWPLPVIKSDGIKTPRFYTLKQYFKYVRPGAVRIMAQSDDSDLLSSAFLNSQDETLTVVVINRGTVSKTAAFSMKNFPRIANVSVIRTSANENAESVGQATVSNGSFTYTLPSSSVTTFVTGFKQAAPTGFIPR
jgi:glucuronoarabinoxylan endo-1,4-beta-xylanase